MEKLNNIFIKRFSQTNYEWVLNLAIKEAGSISRISKNPDMYDDTTVEFSNISELPKTLTETEYAIWLKYPESSIFINFNCNYIGIDHFFEPAQFDGTNKRTKEIVNLFAKDCIFIGLGYELSFFIEDFETSVYEIESEFSMLPLYLWKESYGINKIFHRRSQFVEINKREQIIRNYIEEFLEGCFIKD